MEICHEWTYDEEFFCCKKYIWFMLKNLPDNEKANVDLTEYDSFREICKYRTIYDLIIEISDHYKYIPLREIEHKLKQIKQVSNDFNGKDDYVCINPHRYYSEQLKKAFGFAADDVHRELTHEPPPETIEERNARIARDIEKYGKIIISEDDSLDIPID